MNKAVLVIDSGLGGLTTLARIRKILTRVNIIYFADDAFMPYGNKSSAEIAERICKIIEGFEDEICGVVLACNTATGVAVELVRKLFCFPVVGTEPAIIPALKSTGDVAVLVTTLEAEQKKYKKLSEGKNIFTLPQPNLAANIEKALICYGKISEICKSSDIMQNVNEIRTQLFSANISKIVLGCTHYVFLKYTGLLSEFSLFDGNDGVARRIAEFVLDEGEGTTQICFSSGKYEKSQIALGLLKELLLFDS